VFRFTVYSLFYHSLLGDSSWVASFFNICQIPSSRHYRFGFHFTSHSFNLSIFTRYTYLVLNTRNIMRGIGIWASLTLLTSPFASAFPGGKGGDDGPSNESGKCGAANYGLTCWGYSGGSCCSKYGWCGNTNDYCGSGCQGSYGDCKSSTPNPHSGLTLSLNGHCGGRNKYSCIGSNSGSCCSQYGYW
jgi:hypothetical protein